MSKIIKKGDITNLIESTMREAGLLKEDEELTEVLTGDQDKLDVEPEGGDGDIDAKDLKKLRKDEAEDCDTDVVEESEELDENVVRHVVNSHEEMMDMGKGTQWSLITKDEKAQYEQFVDMSGPIVIYKNGDKKVACVGGNCYKDDDYDVSRVEAAQYLGIDSLDVLDVDNGIDPVNESTKKLSNQASKHNIISENLKKDLDSFNKIINYKY
jgi:hypothetical protein